MSSRCIDKSYSGMRLDTFLYDFGIYPSRSQAVKQIEYGNVFINGKNCNKNTLIKENDFIVYKVLDKNNSQTNLLEPQNIPLEIIYEDEDIIVLNKQAGLICHPSPGHPDHTLANALLYRYGYNGIAYIQGEDRPGIVHRLDGDTSGLMICAKTQKAGLILQDEIRSRNISRKYLCLVHGNIASNSGLIDAPIFRSKKDRTHMEVSDKPNARPSVTTFQVLERFVTENQQDNFTLIECKLYSGRTHQIRVHMKYIHHCVVGDPIYGQHGKSNNLDLQRQFLHSYYLEFNHPTKDQSLTFYSQLPKDLSKCLSSLSDSSYELTKYGKEILLNYTTPQQHSFSQVISSNTWQNITN